MPLQHNAAEGTLTIGAVNMNPTNGAWGVLGDERGEGGLIQLWTDFDVRGQDRLLPGAPGVIAYPRRMTVTRHDLRLIVVGDVNGQTSTPVADTREGLQLNLAYLTTNVLDPVISATGTQAATLSMFTGSPRTANIHVLGTTTQTYHLEECGSIWIGTLHISIPGGRFA